MEKSKVIEKLFYYIVTYSYLLLPLVFLFLGAKRKELSPLVIGVYGIVCFVLLFFYSDFPREIRPYFKTTYTFLEYSAFTLIIYLNIASAKMRRVIVFASIAFFAFQIIYVSSGQVRRLDTIPIGIETILIFTYIVYFLYDFSKSTKGLYIYNHYVFWISVGILLYLGGSFFFYILINDLTEEEIHSFGDLTYTAEIIKNILFGTSLLIYSKYHASEKERKTKSVPYLDMI